MMFEFIYLNALRDSAHRSPGRVPVGASRSRQLQYLMCVSHRCTPLPATCTGEANIAIECGASAEVHTTNCEMRN